MATRTHLTLLSLLLTTLTACSTNSSPTNDTYTQSFSVDKSKLQSTGRNPFFILEPGHTLILEGTDDNQPARLTITVLDQTKEVDGVQTRVVEERETVGNQLVEVSLNYFAIDPTTHDVYYFGEHVDNYKNGKVANHDGSWLAGQDGARFGLIMPGFPRPGQRYYQEFAPNVALDRARVLSTTESLTTPAGTFQNCLKTEESSPLEPNHTEYKLYAPNIGLLTDGPLKLVHHTPTPH